MISRSLFLSAVRAIPALRSVAQGKLVASMQYVPPMSSVRGIQNAVFRVDRASFHSSSAAMGKVKTKKAAAKRFLKTGKGDLKYGKAGKRHLNKHKSRTRVRRLGEKGILEGVWAKKMKILLPY